MVIFGYFDVFICKTNNDDRLKESSCCFSEGMGRCLLVLVLLCFVTLGGHLRLDMARASSRRLRQERELRSEGAVLDEGPVHQSFRQPAKNEVSNASLPQGLAMEQDSADVAAGVQLEFDLRVLQLLELLERCLDRVRFQGRKII